MPVYVRNVRYSLCPCVVRGTIVLCSPQRVVAEPVVTNCCNQDCYWTAGRSVLVGNSSSLHADKKWAAIDGRVRVAPKDGRSFGIFWAMTRTQVLSKAAALTPSTHL